MKMIKWTKPSGAKVETNDDPGNIAAAEAAGWTRKRLGRPPKAETPLLPRVADTTGDNDGKTTGAEPETTGAE